MADTGAAQVSTASSHTISGGSKLAPICCKSVMALPTFPWGSSNRKSYQGSNSTLSACINPWRTAR